MPIQFPAQRYMTVIERNWWLHQNSKYFDAVPAPNMGRIGYQFGLSKQGQQQGYSLAPGIGASPAKPVNLRRLGTMYQEPTQTARCNPANLTNVLYDDIDGFDRNFAEQNIRFSGVSRDATGNPLSGVTVNLFRTSDNSFVGSTISDGSGNWVFYGVSGDPFFVVEYMSGVPDVFGTSPNNLAATTFQPGG
jgi:hypothetical protein